MIFPINPYIGFCSFIDSGVDWHALKAVSAIAVSSVRRFFFIKWGKFLLRHRPMTQFLHRMAYTTNGLRSRRGQVLSVSFPLYPYLSHSLPIMTKHLLASLLVLTTLSGCGVLAAPCRVGSAVIKMVPVVGHVAALPTDACAAVIDP
ncbi:hypothetical protein G3574_13720 [Noviherbaspirillum sp. 17J57-3]|uniref:Uncharacterized protein n=2 Tax=Noviherbaspirillum galbum TaxID=2709383 RepID=A0A6B3SN08_9BURK|nr:hypothetical protein [Noviherbaspirillum galbum]